MDNLLIVDYQYVYLCIYVYLSFLVSLEDNVKMIQTWYALLAKIVIVLQKIYNVKYCISLLSKLLSIKFDLMCKKKVSITRKCQTLKAQSMGRHLKLMLKYLTPAPPSQTIEA